MEPHTQEPEPRVFRVAVPRRVIVTPVVIALNVLWFAWMVTNGVDAIEPRPLSLLPFGADIGALVVEGETWRILSAAFVHIGLIHVAANVYGLWVLGPTLERLYGHAAFLAIYVAGAVGCSVLSLYVHPVNVSAGASGAVFAIAGALLAFVLAHRNAMPRDSFRASLRGMAAFVVANLILGALVPVIDMAGHAGGFVAGFAAGWALRRDPERPPRLEGRQVARGAVVALVLAVASVFVVRAVNADPATRSALPLLRADEAYAAAADAKTGDLNELWARVVEHATVALNFDPHSSAALELRAVARANLGETQAALADCDALLAEPGTKSETRARSLRAQIQLARGEFAAARADLERLVALEPDAARYRAQLGLAWLGEQDWAAAERAFEGAVRLGPDADASADIGLWIARQLTGQREIADKELRDFAFSSRGERVKRADDTTEFLLGVALGEEGERQGARAERVASQTAVLRVLRRVQTGNFDEARRQAQGVVDDDPRSWEASVARAIVDQLKR